MIITYIIVGLVAFIVGALIAIVLGNGKRQKLVQETATLQAKSKEPTNSWKPPRQRMSSDSKNSRPTPTTTLRKPANHGKPTPRAVSTPCSNSWISKRPTTSRRKKNRRNASTR